MKLLNSLFHVSKTARNLLIVLESASQFWMENTKVFNARVEHV